MNIFAALDDDRKLRRFLFWYWLLVPFALFAWILLGAANSNMTFQQALNIPFFAVAFLNGCLTILLAGLFKLAGSENERTERVFTLYARGADSGGEPARRARLLPAAARHPRLG